MQKVRSSHKKRKLKRHLLTDRYRSFGDVPFIWRRCLTKAPPGCQPPYLRIRRCVGYLHGPTAFLQVDKFEQGRDLLVSPSSRPSVKKNLPQAPPPVAPSPSLLESHTVYCVFFKSLESVHYQTSSHSRQKNTHLKRFS